jgi:hypothetical protein
MSPFRRQANRRTHKQADKFKWGASWLDRGWLVLKLLLLVAFFSGLFTLWNQMPALLLREVSITGNLRHVNPQLLWQLSGLQFGDHLFSISLRQVSTQLKKHPWVRSVHLVRRLPGQIHIRVEEYIPVALFHDAKADADSSNKNNLLFYWLSEDGKFFKKNDADPQFELPILTGFALDQFRRYPGFSNRSLNHVLTYLREFKADSANSAMTLSRIHFDVQQGLTMHVRPRKHTSDIFSLFVGHKKYGDTSGVWHKFLAVHAERLVDFIEIDMHTEGKIFARRKETSSS